METPKATVELEFEVGDLEFHEIFIVMDNLTGPILGLMFLHRTHTMQDMRQGILSCPYFSMQLKTADHKYYNVMEPILNPCDITIPPNDRLTVQTQSKSCSEHKVMGIPQPSDTLHEEGDVTFCQGLITLTEGNTKVHIPNVTDQPFCIKKRLHIANVSVLNPEQLKNIQPVDPVTAWHLLQDNEDKAIQYVSSVLGTHRNSEDIEQYWFPTPENPGDETTHTPIQKRILSDLRNLQKLEQLNSLEHEQSRRRFLNNNDCNNSMLNKQETANIKNLLVEFHDIFARHRLDTGMNEEFTVKLTPKDDPYDDLCLQMADQRSIKLLAFNFTSRTFAYRRLAQGLSRSLSAFFSFMREYLDKIIKANQSAQYIDDIGRAAKTTEQSIFNLRETFKGIRTAGLKLTMHKCHFGAEINFLGRTITPTGVKSQKESVQNFLVKTKFPKSKKALQRHLGFLNYYRNYIPRLSEPMAPFFHWT